MKVYNNITELIGNTPIIELKKIEEEFGLKAKLFAKVEYFNPAGSIKDRIALAMIEDALNKGTIKEGATIIEPTSGNTGIGLAMVATVLGFKAVIVMPDTMSIERRKLMKAYGAEVVLSDGKLGMKGAIAKAIELNKEIPNSFIPSQFDNPANALAHYENTGPEIFEALDGKVDALVAGVGTGGTITGAGKFLKEKNKNTKVFAVEPLSSPVLSKGESGPHKIQGIGAGFVPSILDRDVIDEVITVSNDDAFAFGKLVGQKEGFLVGISSGAALCGAISVARREENKGKNIVVVFPDSGDRYLSTALYEE